MMMMMMMMMMMIFGGSGHGGGWAGGVNESLCRHLFILIRFCGKSW